MAAITVVVRMNTRTVLAGCATARGSRGSGPGDAPMVTDLRAALKSFSKAKDTPRPVRVVGGLRGVYLRADRVRVVNGKSITGRRADG